MINLFLARAQRGRHHRRLLHFGTERDAQLTAGELLHLMDEAGIQRAVVASEDREIVAHNLFRQQAAWCRQSAMQGRFIPACSVNPWFGESGVPGGSPRGGRGAKMLVLAPALQGFCFGDDLLDDLLVVAAQLRVPVYVHTGPHAFGAPTQLLLAAAEHPDVRFILGPLREHRLRRRYAGLDPFGLGKPLVRVEPGASHGSGRVCQRSPTAAS